MTRAVGATTCDAQIIGFLLIEGAVPCEPGTSGIQGKHAVDCEPEPFKFLGWRNNPDSGQFIRQIPKAVWT